METKQKLNIFHPSTVLMLDDNRSFLEALRLNINGRAPVQIFTSPTYAISKVEQSRHPISKQVDFSFQAVCDLISNPKRFETISVAVVDYDMPEMNGIEFCRAIAGSGVKRLMLTAAADHELAVKAFNEGIIENFILKSDPDLYMSLEFSIAKLQYDHFWGNFGSLSWKDQNGRLTKPSVSNALFSESCGKTSPSEHYLVDQHGSFLLLGYDGTQTWMIIRTEEEIAGFQQVATTSLISDEIINKIAQKTHAPILLTEEQLCQHPSSWQPFLRPIRPVPGTIDYYAMVRENLFDFGKQGTFVSHRDFLNKVRS